MDSQISKDALIATLEDYGTEELMEIDLRNGLALPQRCSWLTKERMMAMINEEMFAPRVEHVRMRNCADPPKKLIIFNEINNELKKLGVEEKVLTRTEAVSNLPD